MSHHFRQYQYPKGQGISINCSKVPSIKSSLNKRSSANKDDNKAATHTTPGAIRANWAGSGPIPNGNKVITIIKTTTDLRYHPVGAKRRSAPDARHR